MLYCMVVVCSFLMTMIVCHSAAAETALRWVSLRQQCQSSCEHPSAEPATTHHCLLLNTLFVTVRVEQSNCKQLWSRDFWTFFSPFHAYEFYFHYHSRKVNSFLIMLISSYPYRITVGFSYYTMNVIMRYYCCYFCYSNNVNSDCFIQHSGYQWLI